MNDSELALLNLVAGRALTVSSSSFMVKARIRLSGRVQDQEALSVIDKKAGFCIGENHDKHCQA